MIYFFLPYICIYILDENFHLLNPLFGYGESVRNGNKWWKIRKNSHFSLFGEGQEKKKEEGK